MADCTYTFKTQEGEVTIRGMAEMKAFLVLNGVDAIEGAGGVVASEKRTDLFPEEFIGKRATVETDVVISSKGDRLQGGNVNSAGQQITTVKQALQNFWNWFGRSAATDDNGRPLVLYHSTNGDFDRFETNRKTTNNYGLLGDVETRRSGIFMTPDKRFSQEYLRDGSGQNVMPVYAAIEQPLDLRQGLSEADERALEGAGVSTRYVLNIQNYWELFDNAEDGTNDFVEGLKRAGFDGAIFAEDSPGGESAGGATYVAFDSAQIKSAIGNIGAFDPNNPDITASEKRNIFGQKVKPTWAAPADTKLDARLIYKLQDKQIDLKRISEAIKSAAGGLTDQVNAYLKEELYHGRAAKQTKDFLEGELSPLVKAMQANRVTMGEFEEYLHNRHAEERNIQVAKVNPKFSDGGSGIDTADARAYLAGLDPAKRQVYESLAKRVDAMSKSTRDLMVASGLETKETIDAWEAAYGKYVPLFREDAEYGSTGAMGSGQGFSVRGPASRRATGSDRPVVDIMANLAMQRERTIVRAEKARVGRALYGLAVQNPNSDFWMAVDPNAIKDVTGTMAQLVSMGLNPLDVQSIMQGPKQTYIDPRTGLATQRVNPALRSNENVLAVRIDGQDKFVFFNNRDERAQRMVGALKNLDAQELGMVMNMSAKVSRYFASVNTQFNPVFGAINLIRDTQGAAFNLTTTEIADRKAQVMAGIMPAIRGIYSDLRSRRAGKGPAQGVWAKEWEEFQDVGGQTGFRDMFTTSEDRAKGIQKEFDRMTRKGYDPRRLVDPKNAVFGWLSDYNETLENAVRLSAYRAAKDKGLSKEQAASIAKNLTVNFNRKGEVGIQAGALYAFFNASVQGTARLLETLRGPAGKKIIAGGMLLGVAQALALAAAGFGDDEPPDFVKERNLVIPTGDGKYVTIPMPLGLNVIPNTSRVLTEWVMSGFKETPKRVAQITGAFLEMFNPIGNAGWSVQTIAPTFADPLVALAENRDWTGKPIAKEDRTGTDPTPGYTRAKDTASAISKGLSYLLNAATGGTDYKPGLISPTPDQIDYLIGQVTGGVGREALKVSQAVQSTFTGEELPSNKVPILGRFYGDTKEQSGVSSKFYANITKLNEHENEIKGRQKDRVPVGDYFKENPEARLFAAGNAAERQVSELRRQKRDMIERGASKESIKLIEQRITRRMQILNSQIERAEQ